MTVESTAKAVCEILTAREFAHKPADVYGFVSGAWPTESDAEELADDFVHGCEAGELDRIT